MSEDNPPPTSPSHWVFSDYKGRSVNFFVSFNDNTRALIDATVTRDPDCLYRVFIWDLGPDGSPDSSTRQFEVPFGTTTITRQQLRSVGLTTIEDVEATQFTMGF